MLVARGAKSDFIKPPESDNLAQTQSMAAVVATGRDTVKEYTTFLRRVQRAPLDQPVSHIPATRSTPENSISAGEPGSGAHREESIRHDPRHREGRIVGEHHAIEESLERGFASQDVDGRKK